MPQASPMNWMLITMTSITVLMLLLNNSNDGNKISKLIMPMKEKKWKW